jgi:hypothetical protein
MDARRWHQFLSFMDRARSKPTFDVEERQHRLAIAKELRQTLEAPQGGIVEALQAIFRRPRAEREYDLTDPADNAWLRSWARLPASSLPATLQGFAGSASDPVERFERFAAAAAEAGMADNVGAVLALGSLLNFALAPESSPVVSSEPFDRMEYTLGYPVSAREDPVEQYRRHLAFTRDVLSRAQDAGIPIADLLETASLILVASEDQHFWASGFDLWAPEEDRARDRLPAYLAIAAVYRDEAPYLREWIEFHRLVGVDRFFLYNNESTDEHREVLAPYIEDGTVVLHEWPVISGRRDAFNRRTSALNPQLAMYSDSVTWHRHDSRWIAFIDLDEFLYSPTGARVSELLTEYERWPGVVVNRAEFHSSGHRAQPTGPVIGSYRIRIDDQPRSHVVKSIVQPTAVVRPRSCHHFLYTSVNAVDENHHPVGGFRTKSVSFSRLKINHYHTKSEEEYLRKMARGKAGYGRSAPELDTEQFHAPDRFGQPDESIFIYIDPLERALG